MNKDAAKKSIFSKKWFAAAAAATGVLLLILGRFIPSSAAVGKRQNETKADDIAYYSERLEEKIESLVSKVSGAGEADVVITLDCTDEYVYAQNTKKSEGSSAVDYLVLSGSDGESGLPVCRIYPTVRGVAVVCGGGRDAAVKKEITELIASALGISASKITVTG